jgi:transposase
MTEVTTNFSGQTIYVGLDVHKRSWNAALYLNNQYLRNVHQPPSPEALHKFLQAQYPKAHYVCAYEGGKFGFWIQRYLTSKGIECLVVNPADVPSTHKDEVSKTDPRDARTIAMALQCGQLKGIYVPSLQPRSGPQSCTAAQKDLAGPGPVQKQDQSLFGLYRNGGAPQI